MNLSLRCLFICFLLQNPVNPHLMQILLNVTLLLLPRVLVLIPTAVAIIAIEVQNTMTLLIQASGGQIFHGDNRTPSHDNCSCYQIWNGFNHMATIIIATWTQHPPPSAHFGSYGVPSQISNQFKHYVIPNLASLIIHDNYWGFEHLHVGNEKSSMVSHCSTSLYTPSSSSHLSLMFFMSSLLPNSCF